MTHLLERELVWGSAVILDQQHICRASTAKLHAAVLLTRQFYSPAWRIYAMPVTGSRYEFVKMRGFRCLKC